MTEKDFQNIANRFSIEGLAEDLRASVRFFDNVLFESDTGEELTDEVIDNYYS